MCQSVLQNPGFFAFLFDIDQDHAAEVRARGCPWCFGALHQSDYERKPRGMQLPIPIHTTRLSYCCAICRRRCTPESVRFLGRRVYLGAVVLLATALCSGLNLRRGRLLSAQLGVPARTIERWRRWWLAHFAKTPTWRDLRGRFMPPISDGALPGALLARARPAHGAGDAVGTVLRWLAPISTITEVR